jgi:hypothetical protein
MTGFYIYAAQASLPRDPRTDEVAWRSGRTWDLMIDEPGLRGVDLSPILIKTRYKGGFLRMKLP